MVLTAPSRRDDLHARVTELENPVHFLVGRHDLTAMPELSRAYLDRIAAPSKALHSFEDSAHSPLFEEPVEGRAVLARIGRDALR